MSDLDTLPRFVKSSIEDDPRQDAAGGMHSAARTWTPERIKRLLELAAVEPLVSYAEMARQLGVTQDAPRNKLSQLGIVRCPQPEPWPPERVERLIALWEEGLPTREIGHRLGVSKNAVIGKLSRMALGNCKPRRRPTQAEVDRMLALDGSGTSQRNLAKEFGVAPRTMARRLRRYRANPVVKPSSIYSFQQLDTRTPDFFNGGGCLWPIGDPGTPGFHFCGAHDLVGRKPYCAAHAAIAYERPTEEEASRAMTPSLK